MVLTHLFWQKPLKVNGNQLLNFFLSQMINQNKKKKAFLDYRLDDLYVWSVFPVNYIRHLSNDQFWTKDTELESFVNLIVCFSSISIMNITRNCTEYPMYSLKLWSIFIFEMIRLYATILLWRPSLPIMKMHVPWVKKRSVVMKKERGEESNDYFSIRDDKRCNVLDSPYFWTLSVLLVYCSERNPSARTGR